MPIAMRERQNLFIRRYLPSVKYLVSYRSFLLSKRVIFADSESLKGLILSSGGRLASLRMHKTNGADVCLRMLTYAHVCSRMLTYAVLLSSGGASSGLGISRFPLRPQRALQWSVLTCITSTEALAVLVLKYLLF